MVGRGGGERRVPPQKSVNKGSVNKEGLDVRKYYGQVMASLRTSPEKKDDIHPGFVTSPAWFRGVTPGGHDATQIS